MESVQVREYMDTHPVTFKPDMVIEEASEKFVTSKQTGGPVIDVNKRVVGFLSESDVLAKMLETSYYNEQIANVEDIMRKDVLSVKPYDSIVELAQMMLKNKPKVYPVVDDSGNLLGTISRNDVLVAFDKHMHANFVAS